MIQIDQNYAVVALQSRIEVARENPLFLAGVKAAYQAAEMILSRPKEEAVKALADAGGWTKVLRGAYDKVVKHAFVPGPFNAVIPLRTVLSFQDIQDIRNEAIKKATQRTA